MESLIKFSGIRILSSEHLTGADKRALVGTIIEKVVCHKEGSDVYFKPGLFGESDLDEASRSTFQTTCVVCRIEIAKESWRVGIGNR